MLTIRPVRQHRLGASSLVAEKTPPDLAGSLDKSTSRSWLTQQTSLTSQLRKQGIKASCLCIASPYANMLAH